MASESEDGSLLSGRNLIIDEGSFEESFLRCMVCREKFGKQDRIPKFLQCNHTFCLPCLRNVYIHADDGGLYTQEKNYLRCPTCRKETHLSQATVESLPTDHRVIQMMDFVSAQQTDVRFKSQCNKHDNQPVNFYCKKCMLPICRDCTMLDHRERDGHTVTDLKTELEDSAERFTDIGRRCQECIKVVKELLTGHENASKRLDVIEKQIKCLIKETFIEYRLLLEKREKALAEKATEMIKEQKSKIDSRALELMQQEDSLERHARAFSRAKESKDLYRLFSIEKEINEIIKKDATNSETKENDDDHFKSFTFEKLNEINFAANVGSLGEVVPVVDPSLKMPFRPNTESAQRSMSRRSSYDQATATDDRDGRSLEEWHAANLPERDDENYRRQLEEETRHYEMWMDQGATLERRHRVVVPVNPNRSLMPREAI